MTSLTVACLWYILLFTCLFLSATWLQHLAMSMRVAEVDWFSLFRIPVCCKAASIHCTVGGHLPCFQLLAFLKKTGKNIRVCVCVTSDI